MLSEKEQREKDARQRELSLLVGRRLTGVTGTSERIKPQKNLSHECVAAKYTAAVPLPLAGTADAIRFPKVPMAASPKLRHYLSTHVQPHDARRRARLLTMPPPGFVAVHCSRANTGGAGEAAATEEPK